MYTHNTKVIGFKLGQFNHGSYSVNEISRRFMRHMQYYGDEQKYRHSLILIIA